MPIASVVPPATLTVGSAGLFHHSPHNVPNVDFVSLNYLSGLTQGDYGIGASQYFYTGPSVAVENVARAASVDGSILRIRPPGANTSWSLDFPGPGLRCTNASSDFYAAFMRHLMTAIRSPKVITHCKAYSFLAWTPSG